MQITWRTEEGWKLATGYPTARDNPSLRWNNQDCHQRHQRQREKSFRRYPRESRYSYFGREEKQTIVLLEILRHGYKIEGLDYFAYDDVCRKLCWTYSDYALRNVLKHRKYPSSPICLLDKRLKALGRETNCLRIYEDIYSI